MLDWEVYYAAKADQRLKEQVCTMTKYGRKLEKHMTFLVHHYSTKWRGNSLRRASPGFALAEGKKGHWHSGPLTQGV